MEREKGAAKRAAPPGEDLEGGTLPEILSKGEPVFKANIRFLLEKPGIFCYSGGLYVFAFGPVQSRSM